MTVIITQPSVNSSAAVIAIQTSGHPTTGTWAEYQAIVDSNGNVWTCTVGGTPGTWVEGATGGSSDVIPPWAASTVYVQYQAVTYSGTLYSRNTAGTSASTWSADATNWTSIASAPVTLVAGTGISLSGSNPITITNTATIQLPNALYPILGASSSGQYTYLGAYAGTTITLTNGTFYALPVVFDETASIGVGSYISTGGSTGALLRCGIYADAGGGLPGTLLSDLGTVAATGSAGQGHGAYTVSAGVRYWVGLTGQGAPSTNPVMFAGSSSAQLPVYGFQNPLNYTVATFTGATGALPSSPTWSVSNGGFPWLAVIAN